MKPSKFRTWFYLVCGGLLALLYGAQFVLRIVRFDATQFWEECFEIFKAFSIAMVGVLMFFSGFRQLREPRRLS